jgi:hypothetical protein
MITRKRIAVMVEFDVEVTTEWRSDGGCGKPTERFVERRDWRLMQPEGAPSIYPPHDREAIWSLLDDAVNEIPEEEL